MKKPNSTDGRSTGEENRLNEGKDQTRSIGKSDRKNGFTQTQKDDD